MRKLDEEREAVLNLERALETLRDDGATLESLEPYLRALDEHRAALARVVRVVGD